MDIVHSPYFLVAETCPFERLLPSGQRDFLAGHNSDSRRRTSYSSGPNIEDKNWMPSTDTPQSEGSLLDVLLPAIEDRKINA